MITSIKITGFKSFTDFEMAFTPLTVIAGVNASGKSNLFDALQLLSRLAETDLKTAFSDQRGDPGELFTRYDDDSFAATMDFMVELLVPPKVRDNWGGKALLKHTRLRYRLVIARKPGALGLDRLAITHESLEKIKFEEDAWSKACLPKEEKQRRRNKKNRVAKERFIETSTRRNVRAIILRQDGTQRGKTTAANLAVQTVLAGVNSADFPHAFAAKEEMRTWRFLRLDPDDLRQPTRQDVGMRDTISPSGKNLAAALFRIKQAEAYALKEISRKLNSFLPNLTEVSVQDDKTNLQYLVKVRGDDGKQFSSRVLSEGTLRLLALCVLEYDEKHAGLLCLEEPENGIHPFRMKALAQLLKDLSTDFSAPAAPLRQVIVNTHSPVLVSELVQGRHDRLVSVWLSRLHSRITDIHNRRMKTSATKMSPVMKEYEHNGHAALFSLSEPERRLTLSEAVRYLQTAEVEKALRAVQ